MLSFRRSDSRCRVLVTGGMGFIGSHLSEELLNSGNEVWVVDNLSTGKFENIQHLVNNPQFHFAIDDIRNELVMDSLMSKTDLVFHLAATVGVQLIVDQPVRTLSNNILGTEAVLQAALRYRTKVMIASTSEVYGKSENIPFVEEDDVVLGSTMRTRWGYAASKMVDEFMGLAYNFEKALPIVIFRMFNTVGPRQTGQYGMVVPRFVEHALKGEAVPVYGDGLQSRCFLHVHDAIRAMLLLADCPKAVGQVFNIGTTEEITIFDLAKKVIRLVEARNDGIYSNPLIPPVLDGNFPLSYPKDKIQFVAYKDAYGKGFEDMRRRVPNIDKIYGYTGWRPEISLDQTLLDVILEKSSKMSEALVIS
jgi:UDP-glucose 4-epimerase